MTHNPYIRGGQGRTSQSVESDAVGLVVLFAIVAVVAFVAGALLQ